MACRTENKQIGEHEYSVTQWPAEKALLMKFKVTKVLGTSLATALGKASPDLDLEELSKDINGNQVLAFADGLEKMFQVTSPEGLVELLKETIVGAACDGKRITETSFSEHFSGDGLLDVYKVFAFALEVNYGNLFKGQLVENLLVKVKETM